MKTEDVQKLRHGLYYILWTEDAGGGVSLAAVGSKHDGGRWLCCTNWTSNMDSGTDAYGNVWDSVKSAELITTNSES